MRISKAELRQIIQEAIATSLNEREAAPPEFKPEDATNLDDPMASSMVPVPPVSPLVKRERDATADKQGPVKPIKEPETKPTIPTELTVGATEEFKVGDKGTVNIGGSMRSGTYDNLDDLLSGVKFGGKGQYDLGQGVGAYGSVDYTIKPSAESLGKIQSTLGLGLTFNDMVDVGILLPFKGLGLTDDLQGRVGLNVGALNLAMHAGKGGARTGNIGASANIDVGELFRDMQALAKKQNLQEGSGDGDVVNETFKRWKKLIQ